MKEPTSGELTKRISLYEVSHSTSGDSQTDKTRTLICTRWAKCEIVGGLTYWDSVQTNETVTHRFFIRAEPSLTRPQDLKALTEIVCDGIKYRVRRLTDLNAKNLFTVIECEELGDDDVF